MSITLEEEIFGLAVNPFTKSPEMVRRYTLKNSKGMTVSTTTRKFLTAVPIVL